MDTKDSKVSAPILAVKRFYTFAEPPKEMVLESGARLGPVTLAYETYGKLNAAGDNAILVAHAFSGDSHAAGRYGTDDVGEKPGWWDFMIGPGKGIDTDKYFVVCSEYSWKLHGIDRAEFHQSGHRQSLWP